MSNECSSRIYLILLFKQCSFLQKSCSWLSNSQKGSLRNINFKLSVSNYERQNKLALRTLPEGLFLKKRRLHNPSGIRATKFHHVQRELLAESTCPECLTFNARVEKHTHTDESIYTPLLHSAQLVPATRSQLEHRNVCTSELAGMARGGESLRKRSF